MYVYYAGDINPNLHVPKNRTLEPSTRNPNLAVVGMHGPRELTGLALLESHNKSRVEGWDVEIADYKAIELGIRSCDDVWRNFPGDISSNEYALRRPAEILALAEGRNNVLEVHDRPDATGEYVATCIAFTPRLLGMAALLGIHRVVDQRELDRLGVDNSNTLVVELCRDEGGATEERIAHNVARLRRCMAAVAWAPYQPSI